MSLTIQAGFVDPSLLGERNEVKKAEKALQEFEQLLIEQMFSTSEKSCAPTSQGGQMWQNQLYQLIARQMATADTLGLKKLFERK